MFVNKLMRIASLVLAGTILTTATVLQTHANQAKKEPGPSIQGTVKAVDSSKKPVTVTVTVLVDKTSKKTEEKTLSLAADAKFVREESQSKDQPNPSGELADLTEGTGVTLQLDPDGKTVVGVSARGPTIQAHVKAVDGTKNSLTVTTKEAGGLKEYTLELVKGAKVFVDDGIGKKGDAPKEGKLTDVVEGANVIVQASVNRKSALSLRLQGASLTGTLKGYDAGNRILTVTVKEDAQVVDKTFTLAEGARVDGDLTAGKRVSVRLAVKDKAIAVGVNVAKDDK